MPPKWDGISFKSGLTGEKFKGREYLVFDHGIYSLQRSVRTLDYMLTRTYHPGLYPIDEPIQLFSMKKDPHQTKDVAKKHPSIVKVLEEKLSTWWHEQLPKHSPEPDPLEVMTGYGAFYYYKPEQLVKRLKKRGWHKQANELIARISKFEGFHPFGS